VSREPHEEFYKTFIPALEKGAGALFVGAGLSCSVGYPDWRGLLRDIAATLKLDIENEHDLAGIAQYHLNSAGRNRVKLAQVIKDAFLPTREPPESLEIVARLPFSHIWTTNYDNLIEQAFLNQSKILEVKSQNADLPLRNVNADTTLFKMHGTVDNPTQTVIATDDYELYLHNRSGFAKSLDSDFINRTFLFTGLSLRDPNLSHLFSMARATFFEQTPEHFAVLRKPQSKDFPKKDEFDYHLHRHSLWTDDLHKRYNINVLEIDDYDELSRILGNLETRLSTRNVFVSGSYPEVSSPLRLRVELIARRIGAEIARLELNLVNGFGLVIGSATISGFIDTAYHGAIPNLGRRLVLRPFPQGPFENVERSLIWRKYRQDMLSQAGIAIFIGGVDEDGSPAEGVLEEYEIAKAQGKKMLAIPIAGSASEFIFAELQQQDAEQLRSPHVSTEALDTDTGIDRVGEYIGRWLKAALKA
jgi:hypothetical protein